MGFVQGTEGAKTATQSFLRVREKVGGEGLGLGKPLSPEKGFLNY